MRGSTEPADREALRLHPGALRADLRLHLVLVDLRRRGPRDEHRQPAPAPRGAADRARRDPRRRRQRHRRLQAEGRGRRPHLRPQLPRGRPLRQPDRLQLRPAGPGRVRALPQRRARRRQDRVPLGARRASRPGAGGLGRADGDRPRGPADGRGRPRRPERLGRRARPVDGRGSDDGERPDLRPERRPRALPAAEPRRGRAALQPRHPGRLSARIDDEGRHRDRRARQRRGDDRHDEGGRTAASRSPVCRSTNSGGADFGDDRHGGRP